MYVVGDTDGGTYVERLSVDGVKSIDLWSASLPAVSATFHQTFDELFPELRLPALLPALLAALALAAPAALALAFPAAAAAPFAAGFPPERPIAETAFLSAGPHPEVASANEITSANETRATTERSTGGSPLLQKKRCQRFSR